MPARSSLAPGAVPIGLSVLLGLPEHEIQRILLLICSGDLQVAVAAAHVVQILVGQLAVSVKFSCAVIDRSVLRHIGIALVDQSLDHIDHAVDLAGSSRVHGSRPDVQARHILLALLDISLGDHRGINSLFQSLLDDLVIDIREVGYIVYLVPLVFKIASHRIKYDHGTRIADVDQVVNGRTAYIHAHLAGFDRHKFLFASGHCVKDLHCIPHFNINIFI